MPSQNHSFLQQLVVRECNLDHNHCSGEEIYRHYPSARKLSKDEEKDITYILSLKANSKHVHDLIARRYDIQNLKTKARAKFPGVHGFQDVLLSRTLTFEPQADCEFIQTLNCAGQHWVCISTIACKPQVVKVYDSMRTGDVPTSTKESIATLLNTLARTVYLVYPDIHNNR